MNPAKRDRHDLLGTTLSLVWERRRIGAPIDRPARTTLRSKIAASAPISKALSAISLSDLSSGSLAGEDRHRTVVDMDLDSRRA